MAALLHTPILHRLVSRNLLLLTYTGRKSGKRYTTPVGYHRHGETFTILTKRFRTWWRNFQPSAPVEVYLEGKAYHGEGHALTDASAIIPIFTDSLAKNSMDADIFGVHLDPLGVPNSEDIRRIAPNVVVLQITLNE
jgi:hypothetical protein